MSVKQKIEVIIDKKIQKNLEALRLTKAYGGHQDVERVLRKTEFWNNVRGLVDNGWAAYRESRSKTKHNRESRKTMAQTADQHTAAQNSLKEPLIETQPKAAQTNNAQTTTQKTTLEQKTVLKNRPGGIVKDVLLMYGAYLNFAIIPTAILMYVAVGLGYGGTWTGAAIVFVPQIVGVGIALAISVLKDKKKEREMFEHTSSIIQKHEAEDKEF